MHRPYTVSTPLHRTSVVRTPELCGAVVGAVHAPPPRINNTNYDDFPCHSRQGGHDGDAFGSDGKPADLLHQTLRASKNGYMIAL